MKYITVTHTAYQVHDIKIFDTEKEAKEYGIKYISKYSGVDEKNVKSTFSDYGGSCVENGIDWYGYTNERCKLNVIDDEMLDVEPDFYTASDNRCQHCVTFVIEADPYDKFFTFEIGSADGDIHNVNHGGYVVRCDAEAEAEDVMTELNNDYGDPNDEYEVHYDTNRNKMEICIETGSAGDYYRCIILDVSKPELSIDNYIETEEKKEEIPHKLTPQEISAKAAEDAEIRRTLQHVEYETKKKLHEVLSRLSPEQYTKFLEMALVIAAGLETTMVTNDKTSETSSNNTVDNNNNETSVKSETDLET